MPVKSAIKRPVIPSAGQEATICPVSPEHRAPVSPALRAAPHLRWRPFAPLCCQSRHAAIVAAARGAWDQPSAALAKGGPTPRSDSRNSGLWPKRQSVALKAPQMQYRPFRIGTVAARPHQFVGHGNLVPGWRRDGLPMGDQVPARKSALFQRWIERLADHVAQLHSAIAALWR